MNYSWTKKDFKFDWFSGSGAGGQHRNKHQNCLRLTHLDSGIVVTAQNFKERKQNISDALNRIAPMLVEHYYDKQEKQRNPEERIVRTYNIPDNRVIDHISGKKSSYFDFDLDEFIIEAHGVADGN